MMQLQRELAARLSSSWEADAAGSANNFPILHDLMPHAIVSCNGPDTQGSLQLNMFSYHTHAIYVHIVRRQADQLFLKFLSLFSF